MQLEVYRENDRKGINRILQIETAWKVTEITA